MDLTASFGTINLCPRFFSPSMPEAGIDSRASTLVHEVIVS